MTSASSTLVFTQEWIDGNSFQHLSQDDEAELTFAQELYDACLEFFTTAVQGISKLSNDNPKEYQLSTLKEELGKLYLWGTGFDNGKLGCILGQSDELRDDVLGLLSGISRLLLNNFRTSHFLQGSKDLTAQVAELSRLVDRSRLITSGARHNYPEDVEHSTLKGNEHGTKHQERASLTSEIQPTTPQKLSWASGSAKHSLSTLDEDSDTGEESSDESCFNIYSALRCQIDCLMDLVPTMKQSLTQTRTKRKPPAISIPFAVSEAARPFVLNVYDKFNMASRKLIERLGESNWQRYVTVRARMDQIANTEANDEETREMDRPKPVVLEKNPPQSVFTPYSVFHDSGIGTSMTSASLHAASVASHTSFISSQAEEGNSKTRVPPTPPEVARNEPFRCFICGHVLFKLRNRVEWKLHVFADLQPYICTFDSCKSEMVKFPTRKLWSEHEFSEHRRSPTWHCPLCSNVFQSSQDLEDHLSMDHANSLASKPFHLILDAAKTMAAEPIEEQACPLCKAIPGKSQRNFAKHVGRHMETIALAALPRAFEDDSDEGSPNSVADSDLSARFISPEDYLPEQEDFGRKEDDLPLFQLILPSLTKQFPFAEEKRCPYPDCQALVEDLVAHMLMHRTERPVKCPVVTCEYHKKGFARKSDGQRHTLTHYKGTMVCGFCPGLGSAAQKEFCRADVFKHHLTSVHGVERPTSDSRIKSSPKKSAKNFPDYPINALGRCSTCLYYLEQQVEVVERIKEQLGEEHPDTLVSMGNLATTFREQEQWREAKELEGARYHKMYGAESLSTLINTGITVAPSHQKEERTQKEADDITEPFTKKQVRYATSSSRLRAEPSPMPLLRADSRDEATLPPTVAWNTARTLMLRRSQGDSNPEAVVRNRADRMSSGIFNEEGPLSKR